MVIKTRYRVLAAVLLIILLFPAYARVYRVDGSSDAPSYLLDDLVILNRAAYDLRLPYTNVVIFSHSDPERGDVVMFRDAENGFVVFKRIVGCPGDYVAMAGNRLIINDTPLHYEKVDTTTYRAIDAANHLGSVVANEIGNGPEHSITFTPGGSPYGTFAPVRVPDGYYFLLGDNRDNSKDSRMYGPVAREAIIGRLTRPVGREG